MYLVAYADIIVAKLIFLFSWYRFVKESSDCMPECAVAVIGCLHGHCFEKILKTMKWLNYPEKYCFLFKISVQG